MQWVNILLDTTGVKYAEIHIHVLIIYCVEISLICLVQVATSNFKLAQDRSFIKHI